MNVNAQNILKTMYSSGYWQKYMTDMFNRKPTKIIWHQLPGRKLKATWEVQPRGREYGLNEDDMLPIQEWVETNLAGSKRISFDTWLFKSDKHVTMFLLRWS